ncbi:hypothetical protein Tsubulata_027595 [Turnera subulata]|uniref:RNA polymerase sigma-70 domain-containing protein n=1 Tax=Turnera subulata TaxID=218843 RepID=A0A9Q0F777_9ROSI|nr:hypothetical protein Tsubulata_027595 [Turnera subulata]
MGVVTVPSSAARSPLGLSSKFSTSRSTVKRPLVVAFKDDKSHNSALVVPHEQIPMPIEQSSEKKRFRKTKKRSNRVKATKTEVSPSTLEVDYNEAAAKLENLYRLSPFSPDLDVEEDMNGVIRRSRQRKRKAGEGERKALKATSKPVVKNQGRKVMRLGLDQRIALRKNKIEEMVTSVNKKNDPQDENEKIKTLKREYYVSAGLAGLDWKTTKIPPLLSPAENSWLFKQMQPMKALFEVIEQLQSYLGREPTQGEVARATNMNALDVRNMMEVGKAARNKLIKHNLRLVLFGVNKYFEGTGNGSNFHDSNFHDLCQAGLRGLITAIDRFQPKKKSRLSTYALFWIRHTIIRSMAISSLMHASFGLHSLRIAIQKAKNELSSKLDRDPTEQEIMKEVGISAERYRDVMMASRPVLSLNTRNSVTQQELIDGIADDANGGDSQMNQALLRLAIDDVLDSLKPKESLVIRQRFGLDGKGNRSLAEIAGNLNISREMVRKHELKALMKLKHPARLEYIRPYVY